MSFADPRADLIEMRSGRPLPQLAPSMHDEVPAAPLFAAATPGSVEHGSEYDR